MGIEIPNDEGMADSEFRKVGLGRFGLSIVRVLVYVSNSSSVHDSGSGIGNGG